MRYLYSCIFFVLFQHTAAHSQELFACDLVDTATAASVLGSELSRHTPSRGKQALDDGVLISECIFFANKNRARLHVKLVEYPSVKQSVKAFSLAATASQHAKHTKVTGIGDAATWWSMDKEAYGFNIQKGRLALVLETRWMDSNTDPALKDRLRPVAIAAVKKM